MYLKEDIYGMGESLSLARDYRVAEEVDGDRILIL